MKPPNLWSCLERATNWWWSSRSPQSPTALTGLPLLETEIRTCPSSPSSSSRTRFDSHPSGLSCFVSEEIIFIVVLQNERTYVIQKIRSQSRTLSINLKILNNMDWYQWYQKILISPWSVSLKYPFLNVDNDKITKITCQVMLYI